MKSYTMYADKLNKEYTEAFDQVVTYLSTETIDEVTKDEQLGDLFDLFLTAQTAGRPVKRITGGNMEYFCRSFVSEFGWKNRLLYFADYTKRVAWFLLVFSVLDMLIAVWDGGFSALLNPTDVTNYFGYLVGMAICALVGALVGTLTRRTMFRLKKVSMRVLQIVAAVVAFVAMAALFAFIFNTESSFPIPPWVAAAVCCVYLGIYYLDAGKVRGTGKCGSGKGIPQRDGEEVSEGQRAERQKGQGGAKLCSVFGKGGAGLPPCLKDKMVLSSHTSGRDYGQRPLCRTF